MDTRTPHPLTDLPRNATLRVADDGRPHVVAVFEGQVWVTQSGDSDDFIVSAGESVRLDGRGLGVVQAMVDSRITVLEPTEPRFASRRALHA